jgi:hypothetical protein
MLQSLSGGLIIPQYYERGGAANFTNTTLDAAGETYALVFQAPKTGTIDRIGFRTGTVTTGNTVDVRLETVSATTGDPSGSLVAVGANAAVAIADGDDNVWKEATLTTPCAVTRGTLYAACVVVPASTNLQIASLGTVADWIGGWNFPYEDSFLAGAWAKGANSPTFNVRYTDGTYPVLGNLPVSAIAATTFNSDSSPDERGLYFTLPFPARLSGAMLNAAFVGGSTLTVYDSDGSTVLTSLTIDADHIRTTSPGPGRYLFPSAVELDKDEAYRLTVLPASTSDNTLTHLTVSSAAMMDALDGGQAFHLTTREGGGAWSQTTTQRPLIHLVLDACDDAAQNAGAIRIYRLLQLLGVGR